MATRARIFCAVSIIFIAGCTSSKVSVPTSAKTQFDPPVPQPSDGSWPADAYLRVGVPDPGRLWAAADYRDCRDVLYGLNQTNRAALPRMESPKSGVVFGRLINPTNTLLLAEPFLPSKERVLVFMTILNRFPAFRDIYRFDAREPVLLREVIELNHTFLRMLGSAVEWDGKPLPAALGETQPATFHLSELSRTYNESLLNLNPEQSAVPRGDRFIVVGAYTAATVGSFLPWLADGTALTQADRLRAIGYLREDMPILWPHLSVTNQRELLGDLEEVLRRTSHEDIRRSLDALRQHLASGGR
jgi:hypothetical protein